MDNFQDKNQFSFSVIIPFYRAFKHFEECINSVLHQSYQNFEIIIVIDGPDAGIGQLQEFINCLGDKRISIITHEENKGLAAARNTGIKSANFDWIITLDADDKLPVDIIEYYNSIISDDLFVDFYYGDLITFGRYEKISVTSEFNPIYFIKNRPSGAGALIHKRVFSVVKYDESEILKIGNEDDEFWMNVGFSMFKGKHVNKISYEYRKHENTLVSKLYKSISSTTDYIAEKHKENLLKMGYYYWYRSSGYLKSAKYFYDNNQFCMALGQIKKANRINREETKALKVKIWKKMLKHLFFITRLFPKTKSGL